MDDGSYERIIFLADPELNEPVQETFYGGGAEGYTDYPTMAA